MRAERTCTAYCPFRSNSIYREDIPMPEPILIMRIVKVIRCKKAGTASHRTNFQSFGASGPSGARLHRLLHLDDSRTGCAAVVLCAVR